MDGFPAGSAARVSDRSAGVLSTAESHAGKKRGSAFRDRPHSSARRHRTHLPGAAGRSPARRVSKESPFRGHHGGLPVYRCGGVCLRLSSAGPYLRFPQQRRGLGFHADFLRARIPHRSEPLPMRNRMRVLRAEKDWTQAQLASVIGVSRQAIVAVENGKYEPALPLAFRIARAFEKNVEDVFIWENDKPSNER